MGGVTFTGVTATLREMSPKLGPISGVATGATVIDVVVADATPGATPSRGRERSPWAGRSPRPFVWLCATSEEFARCLPWPTYGIAVASTRGRAAIPASSPRELVSHQSAREGEHVSGRATARAHGPGGECGICRQMHWRVGDQPAPSPVGSRSAGGAVAPESNTSDGSKLAVPSPVR